jgi:hypothetical protein
MSKLNVLLTFLFIVSVIPNSVIAYAGISPAKIHLNFEPNQELEKTFTLVGYEEPIMNTTCPEIISLKEVKKTDEGHKIVLKIKFPDKSSEYGLKICGMSFFEKNVEYSQTGFGTVTNVGSKVEINIPYPGLYAKVFLTAKNINKDEVALFHIKVQNMGDETLNDIKVDVKVYNNNDELVDVVSTDRVSIPKFEYRETDLAWNSKGKSSGKYKAVATLYYGGDKPATDEEQFIIGKIYVEFINATINMTPYKINQFKIDIASWWGNTLKNVYAEVNMKNGSNANLGSFKTVSHDLSPWEKKTLEGYWDASNLGPGQYRADIKIKYEENETIINDWKVNLIQPLKKEKKSLITSPWFILTSIIILVIIFDLVIYIKKKRKKKK